MRGAQQRNYSFRPRRRNYGKYTRRRRYNYRRRHYRNYGRYNGWSSGYKQSRAYWNNKKHYKRSKGRGFGIRKKEKPEDKKPEDKKVSSNEGKEQGNPNEDIERIKKEMKEMRELIEKNRKGEEKEEEKKKEKEKQLENMQGVMERSMQESREQYEKIAKSIKELLESNKKIEKNYKELKNKLSELQQNSNTLKKEMEAMKEDKKELEDKVSKLTKSVNTLKEEKKARDTEINELKSKIDKHARDIVAINEEKKEDKIQELEGKYDRAIELIKGKEGNGSNDAVWEKITKCEAQIQQLQTLFKNTSNQTTSMVEVEQYVVNLKSKCEQMQQWVTGINNRTLELCDVATKQQLAIGETGGVLNRVIGKIEVESQYREQMSNIISSTGQLIIGMIDQTRQRGNDTMQMITNSPVLKAIGYAKEEQNVRVEEIDNNDTEIIREQNNEIIEGEIPIQNEKQEGTTGNEIDINIQQDEKESRENSPVKENKKVRETKTHVMKTRSKSKREPDKDKPEKKENKVEKEDKKKVLSKEKITEEVPKNMSH